MGEPRDSYMLTNSAGTQTQVALGRGAYPHVTNLCFLKHPVSFISLLTLSSEDVVVGVSLSGFLAIWTLKSSIDSKV